MKLPIRVGWLSENSLLIAAAPLLGFNVQPKTADTHGITVISTNQEGRYATVLLWTDYLLFDVAQLIKLGVDLGDLEYCPACKKLKADCDREAGEAYDRNHEQERKAT